MSSERIRQRLEQQIERLNTKLEATQNPARRKKLRERKWALKSRLRGSS
jgi:chaperonin cofactor prefoldin